MLLASTTCAEGRVQQIRHGLWLLATTGKGGKRATVSASCTADLASLAVVLPAGYLGWETHTAQAQQSVNKHFICLLVFSFVFKGNLLSLFLHRISAQAERTSVEQRDVP